MLLRHLEVSPSDNTLVSDIKTAIRSDLKPRYTGESILGFLLQASALDPRFKSLPYLDESSRCDVYDSIRKTVNDSAKTTMLTVKEEPDSSDHGTPSTSGPPLPGVPALPTLEEGEPQAPALPTLEEGEPPAKIKRELNKNERTSSSSALSDLFGNVFVTKVEPSKSYVERIREEIVSYRDDDNLALDSEASDPLLWWKAREDKYPLLSKYAKHLLGIPATSVASEKVFSTAGDVVTAQRACLSGDQVDMLVFLKHNLIIPNDLF